ncbi:hypothetical protein [Microcoleus sp. B9-D4]|uniref:hypothetical protein n=1 Tax=Microcoleus sp. B9-D4 TaxID=2818711 RepID=UPI002FD2AE36
MSELRCCTIVKNGQDARSTKNEFSCGTGILPVPKQLIENGAISQSEVRSQKSYQFRLHRNDGQWGVVRGEWGNVELRDLDFIIPMQPETISEGKKEEGRRKREEGREKERRRKEVRRKERRRKETTIQNTKCPVLPMPNAQFCPCPVLPMPNVLFCQYPGTPNLPEKVYTTDSTLRLFLAKINQKKAGLLSW